MSNKMMTAVGGLIVGLAFMAGAMQGCGGGGGGADIAALCDKGCKKLNECGALFGATEAECKTQCLSDMGGTGPKCTNEAAIVSAANACLAMTDCDAVVGCLTNVPECVGGGGGADSGAD